MKKDQYILISISLLISLFIYLFYRTEKTVVNELLIRLISLQNYNALKAYVTAALPLNNTIIYSLPDGLWIFCITLTSKPYYIRLNRLHIDCAYIPLLFCLVLEVMQLMHITNGRFDYMDIVFFVLFWIAARYLFAGKAENQPLTARLNANIAACFFSYVIVYLAHVLN